jgi:hypothetical protein
LPLDTKAALQQIDEALNARVEARKRSKYDDLSDLKEGLAELVTLLSDAINRFAPPGSTYREKANLLAEEHQMHNLHLQQEVLYGILKSLRTAYAAGYLQSVEELVHADLFSDFMEMADYLLSEGYKDPAAVLGGGVLEEGLRKLCMKNGIAIVDANGKPKKASVMNDDLARAMVYDKLVQKSVTAWLDLRNKAAHGDYSAYDKKQVEFYIQGIRDFLIRHPA